MKRGYTVDEYRRLVDRIRARIPRVAVHSDIIVGFPGETEEDFEGTARLVEELQLDKVHLAKFSMRPGTVAAKLFEDDVPPDEKERRRAALDAIQERSCAAINARYVGTAVEVLAEAFVGGRWRGRTRTNKIVYFEHPGDVRGKLVDVQVEWAGPWSMVGRSTTLPRRAEGAREVIALVPV
jgi:tRNA-2-methylthio-N6-dimethylallyladenosine synthase